MIDRGITAMTEDLLVQYDFSYGNLDSRLSPPSDLDKKKLSRSNLPEKSQTSHGRRRSVIRITPPFKKNNTIL
jgi:hypothetical protein